MTAGKVVINSINIRTNNGCPTCKKEGVKTNFFGERNALYPYGVPCHTRNLDHTDVNDYGGGINSWASFDGTDPDEKNRMGSCYKVSNN